MGVVIETCIKYPRGPTRMKVTDIQVYIQWRLRIGMRPFG
jgi:hypothetical protein